MAVDESARYRVAIRQGRKWATVGANVSGKALADMIRARYDIRYCRV